MSSSGIAVAPTCDDLIFSPGLFPSRYLNDSTESIMIYLSLYGSVVPMRVLGSDSIESVKLRIQVYNGCVVKNQKLVCKGRELARNSSLVRDYGVRDGNVLHLVIRLSDLQAINVKTCCGKEFTFNVQRSCDVGYIKKQVAKKIKCVTLEDQEVICNGEHLEDRVIIDDLSKECNAVIHFFVQKSAKVQTRSVGGNLELLIEASKGDNGREEGVVVGRDLGCYTATKEHFAFPVKPIDSGCWIEHVIVNPNILNPFEITDLIRHTIDGMTGGNYPIRSAEGTGGAYFMPDFSGTYVSVFKPMDEEPMAVNNPQGLPLSINGEGLKKGTRVGEGAFREVAAYILDYPLCGRRSVGRMKGGFSGVPPTVMVRCLHRGFNHPSGIAVKVGSLQKFIESDGSCEDVGPGSFPVEEVHKIAVLDIRLANTDRHAGNILFSKNGKDGRITLVPIDHGYCLPEKLEDCTFDWLYWPQARRPFSEATVDYILALDAEEDIAVLRSYGWELPRETARVLRISTMLLKKGAVRGLTPFEIGSMMCREVLSEPSAVEEMVQEADETVLPHTSDALFLTSLSAAIDRRLSLSSHQNVAL